MPCLGPAAIPDLSHQVWKDPAADNGNGSSGDVRNDDAEDVSLRLTDDSSDDELVADAGSRMLEGQERPEHDTDAEIIFEQMNYDWYVQGEASAEEKPKEC